MKYYYVLHNDGKLDRSEVKASGYIDPPISVGPGVHWHGFSDDPNLKASDFPLKSEPTPFTVSSGDD